jgi:hypothetical protein
VLPRQRTALARRPGLGELGWTDVLPEYDPYKHNPFPIEAGEQAWSHTPRGLDWSAGVYSLSHVALPFPPDDPVYGDRAHAAGHAPQLGAVELPGERNVLVVSAGQLMRLRYNPFFSYVLKRVYASVAAALAQAAATTTRK